MIYYANENSPYIQHYGVLVMKWGHRKDGKKYRSTGISSAIARRSNKKVDSSFKKWNEAIKVGQTIFGLI